METQVSDDRSMGKHLHRPRSRANDCGKRLSITQRDQPIPADTTAAGEKGDHGLGHAVSFSVLFDGEETRKQHRISRARQKNNQRVIRTNCKAGPHQNENPPRKYIIPYKTLIKGARGPGNLSTGRSQVQRVSPSASG